MSTPQTTEDAGRNGRDMAFPALDSAYTPNGTIQLGLTKRELLAAMAMQGMFSLKICPDMTTQDIASDAVMYADALLAALKDAT